MKASEQVAITSVRAAQEGFRGRVGLLLLAALLQTVEAPGATGALDLNFDPGRGADDMVRAILVEPGGTVLVGGSFRSFDTNACVGLARLGPDGRLDVGFAPASEGVCNALAGQTGGEFLVGGHFSLMAGVACQHLARFQPDGAIVPGFVPAFAPEDSVWALAVQPDHRILVGGNLSRFGDVPISGLTRLLPDGRLDPEFRVGTGPDGWVGTLTLLPDGRILAGGDFSRFNGCQRAGVVRLGPDGRVDESFDAGLAGSFLRVNHMVVQADGSVLLGGRFEFVQGARRCGLARLDPNGALDTAFAAAGGLGEPHDEVRSIVPTSDGRLWVAGSFQRINGWNRRHLALLRADGQGDPEFTPAGAVTGGMSQIALQPDGNLLLAGDFSYVNHLSRSGVARLIGVTSSGDKGIRLEIRREEQGIHVRFDTTPGQRYTLEASANLTDWEAWVSGGFDARSVTLPVPARFFGEERFFRGTVAR